MKETLKQIVKVPNGELSMLHLRHKYDTLFITFDWLK